MLSPGECDPVYLGSYVVGASGAVTVVIPADTALDDHKIAAWSAATQAQLGWDSIVITAAADESGTEDASDGSSSGSGDPSLAATGSAGVGLVFGLGALLLAAGIALTVVRRRSVKQ